MSLIRQKNLLFKYRMAIPNRFRKSVIFQSFSLKTNKNEKSRRECDNNFPKLLSHSRRLSGEVLKENFTDTCFTNLVLIAFSLFSSFPYKANFYTHLTDLFQKNASVANVSPTANFRKILEKKLSLVSLKACDTPKVKGFISLASRTKLRFGLHITLPHYVRHHKAHALRIAFATSKASFTSLRENLLMPCSSRTRYARQANAICKPKRIAYKASLWFAKQTLAERGKATSFVRDSLCGASRSEAKRYTNHSKRSHSLIFSQARMRVMRSTRELNLVSNISRTKLGLLSTYGARESKNKNNNKKKNDSSFLAKSKKNKNAGFLSSNTVFKKTVSLNIQIGDYLASGDKVGLLQYSNGDALARSFVTHHLHHLHHGRDASRDASRNSSHGASHRFFKSTLKTKVFKGVSNQGQASIIIRTPKINNIQNTPDKNFSLPIIIPSSGRVLTISKTQIVVQKTQPVLFYDSARIHVKRGEWVKEGTPILTLTHQTLITGDIVQGIPRIEQLFEAFTSPPPGIKEKKGIGQSKFKNVHDTLHSQVRDIFRKYWLKNVLPIAVRKSLEEIQYNIVEMIQKVYLSQGVLIADKHIEIIIRQMTSKGQILDSGSTGLLLEEVLPIRQIENANITTPGKKCLYVPAVVGLTTAALTCDSFISAASFQETTRVLSRDAVVGKSDFLRGLKEKVVIGDLISAGTGLDIYFIYNLFAETIS